MLPERGVDLDDLELCDLQTLQEALNRAAERINLAHFTPVGEARSLAASRLREAIDAFAAGENEVARRVLTRLPAEAREGTSRPSAHASASDSVFSTTGFRRLAFDDPRRAGPSRPRPRSPICPHRRRTGRCSDRHARTPWRRIGDLGCLVSEYGDETLLLGCVMALSAVAGAWST